ncbi:hypothetical protein, partial [Bradyrhizobium ottawaense]
ANGSLRDQTVTTISADGKTVSVSRDLNGDGAADQTEATIVVANGSQIKTVTDFNANGSVRDRAITTTSPDGLSTTI